MPTRDPLLIHIGRQTDGCAYELHPLSRAKIRRRFPDVRTAPSVFVGYDTQADFEALHGPMWRQIAMILTGLSWEQIQDLGGIEMYDPKARKGRKVA